MEDAEAQISSGQRTVDHLREEARAIEKEIHASGAIQANLRENARFRKVKREVVDIDQKIAGLDLEEAGRAKRQFEAKWAEVKERETKLLNAVSRPNLCSFLGFEQHIGSILLLEGKLLQWRSRWLH